MMEDQDSLSECSLSVHLLIATNKEAFCLGSQTYETMVVRCKCGKMEKNFEILQKSKHNYFHKAQRAENKCQVIFGKILRDAYMKENKLSEVQKDKYASAMVVIRNY